MSTKLILITRLNRYNETILQRQLSSYYNNETYSRLRDFTVLSGVDSTKMCE